ncbi:MAG: ABC transporter permease [Chloroflexi bacterium]|nr:ABC transporter permease [Chloroflexota bacterium]
MVGTRFRKILRDIRSRKVRTALVSLSILIGVFGTVTLFTMGELLVRQLRKDINEEELAMIRSFQALPPGVEVDNAAVLETLRAYPGVTRVEGQAASPMSWKEPDAAEFESGWVFGYSEALDQIQLEPPRLTEGEYPAPGQKQIMIERRLAEKYDLGVGDSIAVRVLSQVGEDRADAPEETWTISGLMFFPYGYNTFTTILSSQMLFANFEDAQYISGSGAFSSIYVRFADFAAAEDGVDAFTQTISSSTPYIPVFTMTEDPAQNSQIKGSETISGVMGSLGLLALIVSGFLVFNVLSAIITEQKAQIGIMKSIGATRWDNFVIYSGMALVYGILGVVPGVLLAIPSGYFAAQGLAETSNSHIDSFGISIFAIVLGVVIGLAIPVLASLMPVYSGTRVRIIEALTDLGIGSSYGNSASARLIGRLPLPVTVRQGISNVVRKKGRMIFTGMTLMIAAGAFMGVFAVFVSINDVITGFFNAYAFEMIVSPTDVDQLDKAQTLVTDEFDNVTLKGAYSSIAIDIDGFDYVFDPSSGPPALFANGYDPATEAFDLVLMTGEGIDPSEPDGVVVARVTTDYLDKHVGDKLTIHAGGNTGEYTIVGIADFPYHGVWFNWDTLSSLAGYIDPEGQPVPSGFMLTTSGDDLTADQVEDQLKEIDEVLLANGVTAVYTNMELFKETLSNIISMFQMIFNMTALLIALVGAVGLLTALSMSVFERQKEIGVMRSVGAGSMTISIQFLTEGLIVGLLAWLVGLPVSYFLGKGLLAALQLGDAYPMRYPPEAAIVGLVGMLFVTVVSSLWPSLSAARKTVSNILRYQ